MSILSENLQNHMTSKAEKPNKLVPEKPEKPEDRGVRLASKGYANSFFGMAEAMAKRDGSRMNR